MTVNGCFISYLCNGRDLKSVLLINYCLKKYKSKYDYICLCSEDVDSATKESLKYNKIQYYCINIRNEFLCVVSEDIFNNYLTSLYWGKMFVFYIGYMLNSKYQKCVYLDTDILILRNVDELFDLEINDNEIYMASDMGIQHLGNNKWKLLVRSHLYNSGVIVFGANCITKMFLKFSKTHYEDFSNFTTPDQQILKTFHDNKLIKIRNLDLMYNTWPQNAKPLLEHNVISEIAIVHYVLGHKPWMNDLCLKDFKCNMEQGLYTKWLETYIEFINNIDIDPSFEIVETN